MNCVGSNGLYMSSSWSIHQPLGIECLYAWDDNQDDTLKLQDLFDCILQYFPLSLSLSLSLSPILQFKCQASCQIRL